MRSGPLAGAFGAIIGYFSRRGAGAQRTQREEDAKGKKGLL
jgi:hypothetical protein